MINIDDVANNALVKSAEIRENARDAKTSILPMHKIHPAKAEVKCPNGLDMDQRNTTPACIT